MGMFDFITSPMQWIADTLGGAVKQTGGLGLTSIGQNIADPYIFPVAKKILPLLPAAAGAYAAAPSLLAGAGGAGGGGAASAGAEGFVPSAYSAGDLTVGGGGSSIIPEFLKKGVELGPDAIGSGGPGVGEVVTDASGLEQILSNLDKTTQLPFGKTPADYPGLLKSGIDFTNMPPPSGIYDVPEKDIVPGYGPGPVDQASRSLMSFLPTAQAGAGGAQYGGVPAVAGGGGGGIMSALGLGGRAKYLLPLMMGADYFTKKKGIESQSEAMDKYLAQFKESTEWSESDREGMMTALMGIYSEEGAAAKRKAAASAAARGTGGGGYGRNVERIAQQGREAAARSLAGTYGPSGRAPNISAYLAKGRSAGNETIQDWLGLGGQAMSNYMLSQILRGGR